MKRVILFSGGTACRTINIALCRRKVHVTRIVPAWDSGGSSKRIRDELGILSVGDIRQALMTMAYGEGRAGDVVRVCNTRLSANLGAEEARKEFLFYAQGRHPLLERMEPGLRGAILNYLETFASTVGNGFDFRNGSVGNFILTGACIAHNGDVNTAIFVFRKLCDIDGNVWPSSLDSDLIISAVLNNGTRLSPQDAITKIAGENAQTGVREIQLSRQAGSKASPNPAALEAIDRADLIAFGPGSFYTSVLPHLLVDGLVPAVERARCPKVFVGNILQCGETLGLSLKDVVGTLADHWQRVGGSGRVPFQYVLANRVFFPFEKTVGVFPYLVDDLPESIEYEMVTAELEDAWNRGQHDGDLVADRLMAIAQSGKEQ